MSLVIVIIAVCIFSVCIFRPGLDFGVITSSSQNLSLIFVSGVATAIEIAFVFFDEVSSGIGEGTFWGGNSNQDETGDSIKGGL